LGSVIDETYVEELCHGEGRFQFLIELVRAIEITDSFEFNTFVHPMEDGNDLDELEQKASVILTEVFKPNTLRPSEPTDIELYVRSRTQPKRMLPPPETENEGQEYDNDGEQDRGEEGDGDNSNSSSEGEDTDDMGNDSEDV
jgi:hypothetical protein